MNGSEVPINPISKEPQNERDFYLQMLKSGREILDDKLHDGATSVAVVRATSWRAAKEAIFGP